jgi:Meckel syndrome type 1 protein
MPTDTDKPLNGTPQPFRRPVVWGRPPATVFRVGPLPRGGVPQPGPGPMQLSPGVLSGSLIPGAARTTATAAPGLTAAPVPAVEPNPGTPQEPVLPTAPAQPVAVTADPVTHPAPPVDAGPGPGPVNRTLLYAGIALAALTVLALGGWLLTQAAG